jgi:hypothetical protein
MTEPPMTPNLKISNKVMVSVVQLSITLIQCKLVANQEHLRGSRGQKWYPLSVHSFRESYRKCCLPAKQGIPGKTRISSYQAPFLMWSISVKLAIFYPFPSEIFSIQHTFGWLTKRALSASAEVTLQG